MSEPGGSGAAAAGEGGVAAAAAVAPEPAAAQTEGGSSVGTRASTGSIEKQSNGDEKENLASLNAACMLPNDSSCIRENTSDVTETPTQKQSNGDEKEILVPHSTTCSLPTCSADKSGKTTDITETPERLKRSQKSMKAEGSDSTASHSLPSEDTATMTEVKVKTEVPDEYVQEVVWQDDAKDSKKNLKDEAGEVPAEICVVIGGARNQQTLGKLGSYECGICGKKYKYYNCFQTHVRAHTDTEAASGEGASPGNNFRYTCDICGKKYKYYSCFQEHRDLHAVDDPYDQTVIAKDEVKEEEPEPFQKIGPSMTYRVCNLKTGNYTCEFCGKQYKYYTPYQEHVALHAPIKYSRSPLFVAVKTEASPSGKKAPASIIRCSTLFHRTPSGVPPASQSQMFRTPNSGSPGSKATTESTFSRRMESKTQNNVEETNSSSQNSSENGQSLDRIGSNQGGKIPKRQQEPIRIHQAPGADHLNGSSTPAEERGSKPYTCGACGIQFQFYNNLLEHMQSHAADNENSLASNHPRSPPAVVEEKWKPHLQRNNTNNTSASSSLTNSAIPEKERQNIAERLLRVMCADLGTLSVVSGKEFIKLAQTLVDSGARYGAFSVTEILGNFNTLALKHLPRMYNQVKVKVTCALGSNACSGIGVTCHSQSVGPDSCYILTAYQAEGNSIKSYVLGIKGVDIRDNGDLVHHWVQNVLSEFVMSEIRTVYVTDCKVSSSAFSKAGMCLRCSACALNSVVQSVLNKRTLQARNMHEVIELLNVCEDLAGSTGISKETFGSLEETSPPPCWNSVTDSLLLVHERYEQICEFYSRAKKMNLIQNLNKHLLSNLAAILAPVKQAVIELSNESRPTLQLVLPTYVKLEKLFTSKANDAGIVSKLCHLFLEALKENFKVHSAHKVAMILDPQQKLRPVPPYQHEEIIGKVCELIHEVKESWAEEPEFEPSTKKPRTSSESSPTQEDDRSGKSEVYDYLQEPLFQATPDLLQYWSCVTQKHTKLAKLAFWLLAVPAVGARSNCVNMCEQALLIKRRRLLSPEDMNKLMFLKSNML
ncbi:zinc finger protein 618 isoform X5 [Sphaerodactylus townsendi]|uniref:zinc finger protein 618 isoform X5 n=1 Tax=Sphaerodactylus townsendi TaxID=933632 RepID=UPI0020266B68|nr:zinc finger protein 618 isoform X5 [Sphaerodactylus townsendi]